MTLLAELALLDLGGSAALLSAVSVAVASLFGKEALLRLWKTRRNNKAVDTFAQGAALQSALHRLISNVGAQRAVILEAHNGGSPIAVDRPLYTSIRYTARVGRMPTVVWDKEGLDDEYWGILRDVKAAGHDGHIELKTDTMDDDGKLCNLYRAQDITRAYLFELFIKDNKSYWYCSVQLTQDMSDVDSARVVEEIRVARQYMVQILRDKEVD